MIKGEYSETVSSLGD
jgi:hypothetical protein